MKVTPVSLLIVFFLCSAINAFPQRRKSAIIKYDTAARPGSVVPADGSLMRGAIVFNDNEGIVTLYDKSSDELRAFNARTLVKFKWTVAKVSGKEFSIPWNSTVRIPA